MLRRFAQLDVFSSGGLSGNPLAVVIDGADLSTEEMAQFARWTDLSETTFLVPPTDPDADYRVRIFTPTQELPFAGHPTLGSCQAWLDAGGRASVDTQIIQECEAGLVPIRISGEALAFAAPPLIRSGSVEQPLLDEVCLAVGVDPGEVVDSAWADNGPGWLVLLLSSAERVLELEPDVSGLEHGDIGIVGFHETGSPSLIEVRGFFKGPLGEHREDPVTGSLNASIAQWLIGAGRVSAPYQASQGARLGRAGRVQVSTADGEIWIGGTANTVVSGSVEL